MKKFKFCFILIFFSVLLPVLSQNKEMSEKDKINYLLGKLETPGLKFVRNGEEHSGKEAKSHMERKLNYAGNKMSTVDQFIDYLGTKSSLTGKTYYVILADGKKIESAVWLRSQLDLLKTK